MQIGLFMAQPSFKLLGNQSRVQRFSAMSFSETPWVEVFGAVFWGGRFRASHVLDRTSALAGVPCSLAAFDF